MLVGGDLGGVRAEPERITIDTAGRIGLAVLASFPLTAAALVVHGLVGLFS